MAYEIAFVGTQILAWRPVVVEIGELPVNANVSPFGSN
jgi:hypothetical protein